jgi:hypothetical protein
MNNQVDSDAVKLFLIEEHNEAFFIWNYAVLKKIIPPTGNTLMHIDEHSDSDVPRFRYTIDELDGDLKRLFDFTYNELTISNFIIPALYRRIYNNILNISQIHKNKKNKEIKNIFIRSVNDEGRILIAGKETEEIKNLKDNKRASVTVTNQTIEDDLDCVSGVVLDIDLDYFSCDETPQQFRNDKVEITKDEYYRILNNRYHHIRFSPNGGSMVKIINDEDKFYLVFFDYPYIIPSRLKVTKSEIDKRISMVEDFLRNHNIKPVLIDVCRSRYSAYTPPEQMEYIQRNLLTMLKNLFNIEITEINELLVVENLI